MTLGELLHPGQAVGDAAANGVVAAELSGWADVCGQVVDERLETFQRFRGLREEISVSREINFAYFAHIRDYNRFARRLPHQPEHFGVAVLAVNDDLWVGHLVIDTHDALLQIEHNGTSGVDKRDVVAACRFVSRGWFAVGTKQNAHITKLRKRFVVYDDQSSLTQPLDFAAVVDDVAQTIEDVVVRQFFFCPVDGRGHPEAKAGTGVDFDIQHGKERRM